MGTGCRASQPFWPEAGKPRKFNVNSNFTTQADHYHGGAVNVGTICIWQEFSR